MRTAPAPALLAIAHGSRDPRHAATAESLAARVRRARPGVRVEVAYLDHDGPRVPEKLAALAADGVREAVAVPLLLSTAYHAKHDVPAMLDAGRQLRLRVRTAAALGPHPLLLAALDRRLREAGVWPGDDAYGIVLASAGSTDAAANAALTDLARTWRRTGWGSVVTAFASALSPEVGEAVRDLRRTGLERVAVATYMLAPGFLPDRIARQSAESGADLVTVPVGDTDEVAALAALRYDEALGLAGAKSA
ncbi:sirohydrochlorin chelatase [Yinghuangia soli]|uniref:Sirohydrochlorin chelatase n=1 Tax=Yinghuangia soli TaxID=2908204 RepID=A0AA41TYB9_9ACTN|nr:sirohydrochlorin chelatase [Yinghuangia soli]MCF2526231.1 sirohydrochlorin chelatase [Yinghuangia soli]